MLVPRHSLLRGSTVQHYFQLCIPNRYSNWKMDGWIGVNGWKGGHRLKEWWIHGQEEKWIDERSYGPADKLKDRQQSSKICLLFPVNTHTRRCPHLSRTISRTQERSIHGSTDRQTKSASWEILASALKAIFLFNLKKKKMTWLRNGIKACRDEFS